MKRHSKDELLSAIRYAKQSSKPCNVLVDLGRKNTPQLEQFSDAQLPLASFTKGHDVSSAVPKRYAIRLYVKLGFSGWYIFAWINAIMKITLDSNTIYSHPNITPTLALESLQQQTLGHRPPIAPGTIFAFSSRQQPEQQKYQIRRLRRILTRSRITRVL